MSLLSLFDVPAPAKLNLFLHVTGRRPDGYHLLQSVFVLIDWCDSLNFELRRDGIIEREDLNVELPPEDLCIRAARALQRASNTPLGAKISVFKRIPSGAGMGGGSSDAATVLLALNRLWELHWPLEKLLPIGLGLGADVPFFLMGRNAFVEGIGEVITPIDVPDQRFAVVKPPVAVMTKQIFESPLLARDTPAVIVAGFSTNAGRSLFDESARQGVPFGKNDLQAAATSVCTEVAQAIELLESKFGHARMTGSGSAVFAWAGNAEGHWPPDLAPGWVGRLCRSLPVHPLVGWAGQKV